MTKRQASSKAHRFERRRKVAAATDLARRVAGGALTAAVLLCPATGRGDPERPKDVRSCKAARAQAEQRESAGHLREARDLYASCASTVCGPALLRLCSGRFTALVDSEIPTIVPRVTDDAGAVRTDVQVRMDGELLASQLDGHELPVDPGLHEFTFSTDAGVLATQKLLIVQGQRNRPVVVSTRAPTVAGAKPAPSSPAPETAAAPPHENAGSDSTPAAPSPEPPEREERPRPVPAGLPLVLAGAAAVGLGAGAVVVSVGNKNSLSVAADIGIGVSVGVGVAALGVAAWLFARPATPERAAAAPSAAGAAPARAPARPRYVLDVEPTRSGAMASVAGTF